MTSLRKKRIIFMDQICSIDGNFLKSWNEIKSTPGNNFKGKSPGRFTKLENKGNTDLINSLLRIAKNTFINKGSFSFYTDGFFVRKFSKDTNTQMGFAWAEISDCYTDNAPPIIFQGHKFIPDSVKRLQLFTPVLDEAHDTHLILH
uniref:Uncharacterized protein n=1 Tax=Rhizophagus irregularis (strain DAOM 181602 / DAOM 197198 / MUCL 43194) TaxID=747089 RepID=U9TET3_RHIID